MGACTAPRVSGYPTGFLTDLVIAPLPRFVEVSSNRWQLFS